MSAHSSNIRSSADHAESCGHLRGATRLRAAADYLDTLERQRGVLLVAAEQSLADIAIDPGNRWLQLDTVTRLTAAVRDATRKDEHAENTQ